MSYDREEIDNFVMGSDLWAGMADPILVHGVNDSVFWDLLREKFKGWKHLDCEQNRSTAITVFIQKNFGQPIVCSELRDLIFKLCSIQFPGFVDPHAAPPAPVDERPRDRNGRLMSPKAQKWAEFEKWVNDAQTSSRQVDVRRNSDPEFREFYSTMLRREISSTTVGDGVEDLNTTKAPTKKSVPEEVQLWAQDYRTRSIAEIRRVMSPAMVGPKVAALNQSMFDQATAAGLI
jgi:hypothetical protein